MCSTSAQGNAAALKAGTDMNCVDYSTLRQSFLQGLITKHELRRAAGRVLEHKFLLGVFDPPARNPFTDVPTEVIGSPFHKLKAIQAAQKGRLPLCPRHSPVSVGTPIMSIVVQPDQGLHVSSPFSVPTQ